MWNLSTIDGFGKRFVICFALTGIIGALLIESIRLVNRRQADSEKVANDHTEAIINADRANLLFDKITVPGVREIVESEAPESEIFITYRMKNYGKTIGWTTNVTFQALVSKEYYLPLPPVYDNPTPMKERLAVSPDTPLDTFDRFAIHNFKITLEQAKDLLIGKQYLFIYGFIEFEDQFKRSHHNSFAYCYRFNHYKDKIGDDADLHRYRAVDLIVGYCRALRGHARTE